MKLNRIERLARVAPALCIFALICAAPSAQAAGSTKAATPLYKTYAWIAPMGKAERKARLNHAQKRQIARTQSAKGSGSWICSPSGFGKRAACFTRR